MELASFESFEEMSIVSEARPLAGGLIEFEIQTFLII
jgi:hypothetical protein